MPYRTALAESLTESLPSPVSANKLTVQPLTGEHQAEVLAFLAERPLHTVSMAGFIRDNGLVSPLNRGGFYACRDAAGRLEGVALIGHATLFEARTDASIAAIARLAQRCSYAHVIIGEQEKVERFWDYYSEGGRELRLFRRELLFEQRWPVEVREPVAGLRQATLDDLELVVPAHAQMAFEGSRVNPLEYDPVGFRMRCARRIEQGRTWVWTNGGKLIFKADIIAWLPEATYIEGVYINPEERGRGYGLRCVSQLSRSLLKRTASVCLLIGEHNVGAQALYRSAGYRLQGYYDTIFLQE